MRLQGKPALIVHGGAGTIGDDQVQAHLQGCEEAALQGWEVLKSGGAAIDAVQQAVMCLEDNPLFNAGTGSALNAAGRVEMDASIMDGFALSAGAVGAVQGVRNPIVLARKILEDARHVLLVGEGARAFAQNAGVALCDPESLATERQQRRWRQKHGTVGCVAIDSLGRLAAATSTGGVFDKLPGRVGDSALIGCGTYADETGAVSCTGSGEAIIRALLAKNVLDLIKAGLPPHKAARRALILLEEKTRGDAGVIVFDSEGKFAYARNTTHMPVCLIRSDGIPVTEI